ncbi:VanZ family protein [uncultured Lutibacter sp.]|uniref:VanZ family protein n=1 Tax=uncultured Lutibacter sp. TaxID=437739 RepID=UPI00262B5AA7|nr:VanZ family protein [uncultured Lutibacter sp.]
MPKTISISDKIIHSSAYFLLNLSWLVASKNSIKKLKMNLLISMLVFLYGTIIEVLQGSITSYRQFEFKDLVANFIGIVLAFTIFNFYLQKKVFN